LTKIPRLSRVASGRDLLTEKKAAAGKEIVEERVHAAIVTPEVSARTGR